RLRDAYGPAGDPPGVVPEFPGDRRQAASAVVGQPRGRGAQRTEHLQVQLVAAPVPLPAPGLDAAGPELRRRGAARGDGPPTRPALGLRPALPSGRESRPCDPRTPTPACPTSRARCCASTISRCRSATAAARGCGQ